METPEKKGFFSRLKESLSKTQQSISGKMEQLFKNTREIDDEFYEELESILLQADIGVKMTTAVLDELKSAVKKQHIKEADKAREIIREAMIARIAAPEPFVPGKTAVLLIVGVNGVGKTTMIGKLAAMYKKAGRKPLIAAADTFRAAAAEQLSIWAERADVPIIKHGEGADPAAVVFDAISGARARGCDLILVDTAGRLQNKTHLMEELKKIHRVIAREAADADIRSLLVMDATTGQNGLVQAKVFTDAVSLDGIIITKLDGTAKGGVAIAVKEELSLPVRFIGVGEGLDDLQAFDARSFVEAIF